MKPKHLTLTLSIGLLAVGSAMAMTHYLPLVAAPDTTPLPGLRVDGRWIQGDVTAFVDRQARAIEERPTRLLVDGEPALVRTASELGVHIDRQRIVLHVLGEGRSGSLLARAHAATSARHGLLDDPLLYSADAEACAALVEPLRESVDREPIDARLDLDAHETSNDVPGRKLDTAATCRRIVRSAIEDHDDVVEVVFATIPASVTRETLSGTDITHVLGAFESRFSRLGDQAPRAHNIDLASSHFNGLAIAPGGTISFNQIVGPRDQAHGYRLAHQIVDGEAKDGFGGGACQVASTLHAAAFYAALDIVSRKPHSRPSAYMPLGLDAAVMYDAELDLKIKNPFSFPIVIHEIVRPDRIKTEILGADTPAEVTYACQVLRTMDFERKVVTDPAVSAPDRTQKGIRGIQIRRTRSLVFTDGTNRKESSIDIYPPTLEIWHVPAGYDRQQLPALGVALPQATNP